MFKGIEHIGIYASDSAALAQWYQDVLGWRVIYDSKGKPPAFFLATEDGSMIEIIPSPKTSPGSAPVLNEPGIRHLAITVNDFDKAYGVLQAKKVNFIEPPKDGANGVKVVFFRDPEGNILHLMYRPVPM